MLVVEDDPDVRQLVELVLSRVGYEVNGFGTGLEALEWLTGSTTLPDLVVLDVQMPEMDGWAVLGAIRADDRTRRLPVLLCTVEAPEANPERGAHAGADAHLTKPFSADDLEEAVAAVLGSSSEGVRRAISSTS